MARPRTRTDLSISELENMLHSRRSKLVKLEKKRQKIQRKLDAIDADIASMGGSARGSGRVKNEKSLTETMTEILAAKAAPMKVSELVEAVKATGYRSKSDNFRGIVNQALIKEKQFVSHSRGTYQLKK